MWAIDEAKISQVTNDVVATLRPRAGYLFGSRATGEARPDSDIDLLVIADLEASGGRYTQLAQVRQATRRHRVPIDFLIFTPEEVAQWGAHPTHILFSALTEGTKLYESP